MMLSFASPQQHYPYSPYGPMHGRQPPSADAGDGFFRERIRELARQRARKAQWLPDEVDDELDYIPLYFDPLKAQQNANRMRNDREAQAIAMQNEAGRLEDERARKSYLDAVAEQHVSPVRIF
jgi:hypothetical protein